MENNWKMVFVVSVFVGGIVSLFASSSPDGLEKIAEVQGFLEQGKQFFIAALPDYMMPGVHDERLATSLAGMVGASAVFVALLFIGKYLYGFESKEER